jgi:hypothetical protein
MESSFTIFNNDPNAHIADENWVWFKVTSWITVKHYEWINSHGKEFAEKFEVFNPNNYPALS